MNQIKIRSVIIEDNKNSADFLTHLVAKYCENIEIVEHFESVESFVSSSHIGNVELIFLDINLGNRSGFEITEYINPKSTIIVVTSAFSEYVLKSIQYQFLYYLLKPIDIEELVKTEKIVMEELENRKLIHQKEKKSVVIPMQGRIEKIDIDKIMYIKAERFYSIFRLSDNTEIVSSKNIGNYEEFSEKLIRIHNSYIVNIEIVQSIVNQPSMLCILKDGQRIPISRRRYPTIRELIANR